MNDLSALLSPDVGRNRQLSIATIRKNRGHGKDNWINKIHKGSVFNTINSPMDRNRNNES